MTQRLNVYVILAVVALHLNCKPALDNAGQLPVGNPPSAAQKGGTPPKFFGLHETNAALHGWPSVAFSTFRLWDVYPHASWRDVNQARGSYDWTRLDAIVNLAQTHGVDLVYTFGKTPTWASSNPTGVCSNDAAGSCYPPSNQQDWTNFVAAISRRYAGKIRYWEIWNEPNAANFWMGTIAEMVAMAQTAYPIIKASDPSAIVLSPAPQGTTADQWLNRYFAQGGGTYTDVISFHGYLGATHGLANPPEGILTLSSRIKTVMSYNGQGSKELWDTEHSWGPNAQLPDANGQSAWLARYIILSWSNGVARSIWDGWDLLGYGTLWNRYTATITPPGVAFGELHKWLVGATLTSPCSVGSDSTWRCTLTLSSGQQAEITWNTSGLGSVQTAPGQYSEYSDLDGNTHSIAASQSLPVGPNPILLTIVSVD